MGLFVKIKGFKCRKDNAEKENWVTVILQKLLTATKICEISNLLNKQSLLLPILFSENGTVVCWLDRIQIETKLAYSETEKNIL